VPNLSIRKSEMSKDSAHGEKQTKLLVVDDEDIILSIATDVLESEGYEVKTESNPIKALSMIKEEKFDFVLTDINMPEMNGLELVKKIQEVDSDVGAIFMTGYANLETAKEAIQTGAYDYIMKPFELNELRAAVTDAVEKRRQKVEKSEGNRLDRLSDLVEVLYTMGDKTSLLKLSLGLALVNSGLSTGLISCWEKKSGELVLIWTDNVRQSNFHEIIIPLNDEQAAECFDFESPLKENGLDNHPQIVKLTRFAPEVNSVHRFFKSDLRNTSLSVFHRDQFFMLICVEDETPNETLSESDLNLLNIVINMAMVIVENVVLLGESQQALQELERLHDQMVNLERVATQGIMSAEIGHELNNYLNIVRSNFELLQLKSNIANPDEVSKYMRGIEDSLEQMTRFTSSLADAATLKSEKSSIDLNELIDDIISFLSPQKKFRNIRLSHNGVADLPRINADTRQLQQLFYNLLNNAAESLANADRAERSITISTKLVDSQVRIEVSDNGKGIPEKLLSSMFSSRFTTKTGGHGFGLIVCKKVVENHGGTIDIRSIEGEGATFKIVIPA
jgi:signal transduction histidine kinase/CheY-like chemotaxis protein